MTRPLDVLTVGETMAVLAPERVGPLHQATQGRLTVAGAESTVATGVARLGGTSCWVGSLGDDEFGTLVRTRLRGEGVEVRATLRVAPTGLMVKERRTVDTTRVHYYRNGLAGSMLEPDQVPEELVARARWLHVSGITPALSSSAAATVDAAIDHARRVGTKVSLDVNHRTRLWPLDTARPVLRSLVERADLVFATRPEADVVLGASTATDEDALASLRDKTGATIVLKRGAQGSVALEPGASDPLWQSAFPVSVTDPVGAGDAFVAGFLAEAALGADTATALQTGAAVAAVAVGCDGDWEGLPTRAELGMLLVNDDIVR